MLRFFKKCILQKHFKLYNLFIVDFQLFLYLMVSEKQPSFMKMDWEALHSYSA